MVNEENQTKVAGYLVASKPAKPDERQIPDEPTDIESSQAAQEAAQVEIATLLPKPMRRRLPPTLCSWINIYDQLVRVRTWAALHHQGGAHRGRSDQL